MLARRIIPCLDVKGGQVIKGVQFRDHKVVGEILDLAGRYVEEGADELIFYDITASTEGRTVDRSWVERVSRKLDIPFCVAGGIKTVDQAREILNYGADKISINTPALENPPLVDEMVKAFGSQCVVVGIDSFFDGEKYRVYSHTGDPEKMKEVGRETIPWAKEVQERGAGEVVLNCMNRDGVRKGYDLEQLGQVREVLTIPLVASGGAGTKEHFFEVFREARVDAALAASVFHKEVFTVRSLKEYLKEKGLEVRRDL